MLGSATFESLCHMDDPSNNAARGKGRRSSAASATDESARRSALRSAKALQPAQRATPHAAALPASEGDDDEPLKDCVRAMIGRDQAALGRLYDATCGRVHAVILRIVRRADLAEEVLADVYLQAWRDCHRYDAARGKVIAWLLIIGRTRSLDALRRADEAFSHPTPEDFLSPEAMRSDEDDPLGLLDAARGHDALHMALAGLSAVQRQLVALAFFKGLSHAEIAAHTRLPLGSVKTHIRKALLQLREILADDSDTR